jgi:hypothetical protein
MTFMSFAGTACLALFVFSGLSSGFVGAVEEHQHEHAMKLRQYKGRSLGLKNHTNNQEAPKTEVPVCLTRTPTKEELIESMERIEAFNGQMRDDNGSGRNSYPTISIGINWVVVTSSPPTYAGLLSEDAVKTQITYLNGIFAPDFSFSLVRYLVVPNDRYFHLVGGPTIDPAEIQMKQVYKVGGKATLNVYSLDPIAPTSPDGRTGGWTYMPQQNPDIVDGIVMRYTGVLGQGDPFYSAGNVSFTLLRMLSSSTSIPAQLICSSTVSCLFMRSGIGLASSTRSILDANIQVTVSLTLRHI